MALGWLEELGGRFLQEALGFGVGTAIAEPLRPLVQDLVNEVWALHPSIPGSPQDLAAMVVQGVKDEDAAAIEAGMSGTNVERFHELVLINGSPIAPQEALELLNRGEIDEARARHALLQSRLKPEWVNDFLKLRRQIVQLADLAQMVVQSVIDVDEARQRAAMLGVAGDDFDKLVRLAGNPPGPETTLDLWNRGIIDEAEATLALRQSRLKPEWIEQFKRSRMRPATPSQAAAAVVRERITMAEGLAIAAENGLAADAFTLLVNELGRPIGLQQAVTLYKRKQFTLDQVREVVARSNVRTEYTEAIIELGTRYPSLFQIKNMLQTGAMPDDVASDILTKEGYTEEVITAAIAAGHGVKLAGSRQLTQSAIEAEYKSRAMSSAETTTLLEGIGYDRNDITLLLSLWDYETAKSYRDAVVAVVKARYLQADIDQQTASGLLDQIQLPADERDQLLALWTFDLQANPTLLTLAQLNNAWKGKLINEDDYKAYLPRLRYQEPELSIIVELNRPG